MPEHTFIDLAQPRPACDALAGARRIGVDTEFMREKTFFAELCLVQFAVGDDFWCADPLGADDLADFWQALLEPAWVLHAGRQDLEVISAAAGRLPGEVFDTQVAAALLGHPPQMGYAGLVDTLFDVQLAKSQTRADWSRRPLSAEALDYAAEDVAWLLPACDRLTAELERQGRLEWALEDSRALIDPALYRIDAAAAVDRVKAARNLRGRARRAAERLASWRERRAETSNKPRQWILRDNVLLDIAVGNPHSAAELAATEQIPPGVVRRSGDEFLAILREAEQADDDYEPPPRPDEEQKAMLKKLQKHTAARALEMDIAAEVLAPRRELAAAAGGDRDLRVLRGWRRAVLGDALLDLLGD